MTDIVKSPLRRTTEIRKLEAATLPTLFEVLGCGLNGYDLKVKEHFEWALKDAEQSYRDRMKGVHPDKGGQNNTAAFFNLAIKRIRNIAAKRGVTGTPTGLSYESKPKVKLLKVRVCEICGEEFNPTGNAKTCSPACSVAKRKRRCDSPTSVHAKILEFCHEQREAGEIRKAIKGYSASTISSSISQLVASGKLAVYPRRYITVTNNS